MKNSIWFVLILCMVGCQRNSDFIEAETDRAEIQPPPAQETIAVPRALESKPSVAVSASNPLASLEGKLAEAKRNPISPFLFPKQPIREFDFPVTLQAAGIAPPRTDIPGSFMDTPLSREGRRARVGNYTFSIPSQVTGIVNESFIQGEVLQQFNLLFVIDNSESMADVREFVRTNLKRILEPLTTSRQQLDFRIAVTITDPAGRKPGFFRTKRGVPFVSGRSPLNPENLLKIHAEWEEILNQIEPTRFRGWEQGLKASEESLQKDWASFMRVRSHLAIIWLTDEDDFSAASGFNYTLPEGETGAAYPERHPDLWSSTSVEHYLDFFRAVETSTEADVLLYPVIHLTQPEPGGNDSIGTRYSELVSRWPLGKAKALSIRQDDLAQSFDEIADLTADRDVCFDLSTPMAPTQVFVGTRELKESEKSGYSVKQSGGIYKLCFAPSVMPKLGEKISVTGLSLTAGR